MNIKPIYNSYTSQGSEYKKSNIGKTIAIGAIAVTGAIYGAKAMKGKVSIPSKKAISATINSAVDYLKKIKMPKISIKNAKDAVVKNVQAYNKQIKAGAIAAGVIATGAGIDAVTNKISEKRADKKALEEAFMYEE
ncbi:hypothetical protein J6G99_08815 [bacterium]|nr:hypothetical protein [bacterium]